MPSSKLGERLSFIELFKDKNYRIEVPIIQRDYAQGRSSNAEVREGFLTALKEYLDRGEPNRDLDFIYGSLIENKEEGFSRFIPLDGQQRLTTLFLLHWYLALKEGCLSDFQNICGIKSPSGKWKSKFSYRTRSSAREFCDALIAANDIDLNDLLPLKVGEEKIHLSNTIKDRQWYVLSWKYDPTVAGMLVMLDAIHIMFKDELNAYYTSLTDSEGPIITFQFLRLEEFGLTDDLYIKMNARGRHLTSFENFKAKFEQHLKILSESEDFKEEFKEHLKLFSSSILFQKRLEKYHGQNISTAKDIELEEDNVIKIHSYFSHMIDTDWAGVFFSFHKSTRNVKKDLDYKVGDILTKYNYDQALMNFIRVVISHEYALRVKDKDLDVENLEYLVDTQKAKKRNDHTERLNFRRFEELNAIFPQTALGLIRALDVVTGEDYKVLRKLPEDNFYYNEVIFFRKVVDHELSLPERLQFFAYLSYFNYNIDESQGLNEWTRLIYNLTQNRRIETMDHFVNGVDSIKKLLPHSKDVLSYLKKKDCEIDFFSSRQVQEEQIKAHLLTSKFENEWREVLTTAEQHSYLKGQIGFLLDFVGLVESFENYKLGSNEKWTDIENVDFLNSFQSYWNKILPVLNLIEGGSRHEDFIWERAVLTKGDYLIKAGGSKRNFLSTTKAEQRDYSWKRLLEIPDEKEELNSVWKRKREFVKQVLDDPRFDPSDVKTSLHKIAEDRPGDWKDHFLEHFELLDYLTQGFIFFEDEHTIRLYKQAQANHKQKELFTMLLLKKYERDGNTGPFKKIDYHEVKSSSEHPCMYFDHWKGRNYALDIRFRDNEYEARFFDRKSEKIDVEVIKLLENEGFKVSEDYNDQSYVAKWPPEEFATVLLNPLLEKLERIASHV